MNTCTMAMENAVPQSSPDLEESHPYWEFVIRVLFYKQPNGTYRTWCYIGDSVTRQSFPMDRDFGTQEEARTATVAEGRRRIEHGFQPIDQGRAAENR